MSLNKHYTECVCALMAVASIIRPTLKILVRDDKIQFYVDLACGGICCAGMHKLIATV